MGKEKEYTIQLYIYILTEIQFYILILELLQHKARIMHGHAATLSQVIRQ